MLIFQSKPQHSQSNQPQVVNLSHCLSSINHKRHAFAVSHMRLAPCFLLVTSGVWCVYDLHVHKMLLLVQQTPMHLIFYIFFICFPFCIPFPHVCGCVFFCLLKLCNANAESGLLWGEDLPSGTVFHPLSKLDAVFETVCSSRNLLTF